MNEEYIHGDSVDIKVTEEGENGILITLVTGEEYRLPNNKRIRSMARTRKIIAAFCAVSVLALSGCNTAPAKTESTSESADTTQETVQTTTAGTTEPVITTEGTEKSVREQAEEIVAGMTLEQKIAQMLAISLQYWQEGENAENVTSLNEKQKALLTKYDFGGVLLFGRNITGTEQTVRLTAEIQEAAMAGEPGIPMFISADQEGGDITRLTTGTKTCGNMAVGATGNTAVACDNAAIMGRELYALGINNDFAPDMDVNSNPANPVIGVRSFSSDPALVAKLGTAYIEGLESESVISTMKHFPGHGDTDTDSHTGLPLVDRSLDELKAFELVPFAAAADTADMVMTAHIQFPQIETNTYTSKDSGKEVYLPATLSKTIITDILRGDLGYNGVVVTDDMQMDAIKVNFDPIDAAVLAINADVDILLEPLYIVDDASIEAIGKYISDIASAVNDGRIELSQIDDSVVRIVSLKIEKGLFNAPVNVNEAVNNAKSVVGSKAQHDWELEIAEQAITLIKNDDNTLPLKPTDGEKVAFFYPYAGEENIMTFALDKLRSGGIIPESVTADCHCVTEKSAAEFEDVISGSAAVILAVETYRLANMDSSSEKGWQAVFADELIETAHRLGKKIVVLSMQLPYDAARYGGADALLCAYCAQDMPEIPTEYNGETKAYGVNYPVALITVFGGSEPTGKLPVDIPKLDENTQYTDEILYPIGYGLSY